jgi:hypothetical protein
MPDFPFGRLGFHIVLPGEAVEAPPVSRIWHHPVEQADERSHSSIGAAARRNNGGA